MCQRLQAMWVKGILVVFILYVPRLSLQQSTLSSTYRAAVVEYSPDVIIWDNDVVADAPKNVKDFIFLIRKAAEKGADIVVFPESVLSDRQTNSPSVIPNPVDLHNPCTNNSTDVDKDIQLLSCAARNASIYVVINLTERQSCSSTLEASCNSSDILYNCDVVFDREGTIIARYRKYNLFGEPGITKPALAEYSIFGTDFGVDFGVFTCFDLEFEKPAVKLVTEYGIRNFVFPTHWFSELPFLTAVQAQASWAHGMDVNFLASGYNNPKTGSFGSGIYSGKEGPLTATIPTTPTTQLLVATLPKNISAQEQCLPTDLEIACSFNKNVDGLLYNETSGDSEVYMKRDYLEPYETILLTADKFSINQTLCHNQLCCNFEVKMRTFEETNQISSRYGYQYRMAVFDGVRSYDGFATGGLQICAIIECENENISSCGIELNTTTPETFRTKFDHIHISGRFRLNNATQLPDTLIEGYHVLPSENFTFAREEIVGTDEILVTMVTTQEDLNLKTFGIFGRDFKKDGSPMTKPDDGSPGSISVFISSFLSAISLLSLSVIL